MEEHNNHHQHECEGMETVVEDTSENEHEGPPTHLCKRRRLNESAVHEVDDNTLSLLPYPKCISQFAASPDAYRIPHLWIVPTGYMLFSSSRGNQQQQQPLIDMHDDADANHGSNEEHDDRTTALLYCIRERKIQAALKLAIAMRSLHYENGIMRNENVNHIDERGCLALTVAAQRGNFDLVKVLLCDDDLFVWNRHLDAADVLWIDVNSPSNANGTTALIQASHFGYMQIVRLLLARGADAEKANKKETTALMRASQEGHEHIVSVLLRGGANVNRRNHERMTSLMLASQRGHEHVVEALIAAGAAHVLNERTSQNSTALMLACKRGHVKVVDCLLEAGAELYLKDSRGRTAKDIAARKGFKEMAAVQLNSMRQNFLIRMKVRTQRTLDLRRLWFLMDQRRCTVRYSHSSSCKRVNESLSVLTKAFELPFPVFMNVVGFLPLPCSWSYLLRHLFVGRCHVDPGASIEGIFDIIDEILVHSDYTRVCTKAGLRPPEGYKVWDEWKCRATHGGTLPLPPAKLSPSSSKLSNLGYNCGYQNDNTQQCSNRNNLGDSSDRNDVDIDEKKWTSHSLLSTALTERRNTMLLKTFCNRPEIAEIMLSSPYNMPRRLFNDLEYYGDVQSISRRFNRGISFEAAAARRVYQLAIDLLQWHESSYGL